MTPLQKVVRAIVLLIVAVIMSFIFFGSFIYMSQNMISNKPYHSHIHQVNNQMNHDAIQKLFNEFKSNHLLQQSHKLTALHFIHVGKTGSSLILTLRNYLDSCKVKNLTCNGVMGGGFWRQSNATTPNYRTHQKLSHRESHCSHSLIACGGKTSGYKYHHRYNYMKHKNLNNIIMIREPIDRAISRSMWMRTQHNITHADCHGGGYFQSVYVLNRSIANASDALFAAEVVIKNMTFFGITNYWGISLCLFHCELGGKFTRNECKNTRKMNRNYDTVLHNATQMKNLQKCLEFETMYYNYLKSVFFERVKRCQ
eukprot:301715_1